MQLLVLIAALALFGGNAVSRDEMREIIKYVSNDAEAEKLFAEAEKISSVLSLAGPLSSQLASTSPPTSTPTPAVPEREETALLLKPIAQIADDGIYNALSAAL